MKQSRNMILSNAVALYLLFPLLRRNISTEPQDINLLRGI